MITIDEDRKTVTISKGDKSQQYPIDSVEAFEAVSDAWLRVGWDAKYVYGFSWMGRPIIQLPDDMMRIQEVIYDIKPDVIIETGIAHGGSLIFYASLLKAMGKGRVVGIDIEIREHNRKAIEAHEMFDLITMYEGSSVDPDIVSQVEKEIKPGDTTLILLDSNHLKDHVLQELKAYSPMVSKGSYIVACDGIMKQVKGALRTDDDWDWNNPISAVNEFLDGNNEFVEQEPIWPFNEGIAQKRVTYWPQAFLKRIN